MATLHYHITIRAPKARIHQIMLADASYREWTSEFAPGSYYKGSWDIGAEILFLNPEGFGMMALTNSKNSPPRKDSLKPVPPERLLIKLQSHF